VISKRTRNFKKLLSLLPEDVQAEAISNYKIWKADPYFPPLNFKPLQEPKWSVRIGREHRAIGKKTGNKIVWYWIGSHESYNKQANKRKK